jgi:hypothetical protein
VTVKPVVLRARAAADIDAIVDGYLAEAGVTIALAFTAALDRGSPACGKEPCHRIAPLWRSIRLAGPAVLARSGVSRTSSSTSSARIGWTSCACSTGVGTFRRHWARGGERSRTSRRASTRHERVHHRHLPRRHQPVLHVQERVAPGEQPGRDDHRVVHREAVPLGQRQPELLRLDGQRLDGDEGSASGSGARRTIPAWIYFSLKVYPEDSGPKASQPCPERVGRVMVPVKGLEPPTPSLRMTCSTS